MSHTELLQRIRDAQEQAVHELRESAARHGRVPSALEVHQARVNAGEEVVLADLEKVGLAAAPRPSSL